MSKSTLWKVIRRLGFKYNDSKENTEDGAWEISDDIAKDLTSENITEHIAEEVSENMADYRSKISDTTFIESVKMLSATEEAERIEEQVELKKVEKIVKKNAKRAKKEATGPPPPRHGTLTSEEIKELTCDVCGYVAQSTQGYNHHYKNHKVCSLCGVVFEGRNRQKLLERHVKKCGNPEKQKQSYQCQNCQKNFEFQSYFNRHKQTSKCRHFYNDPENNAGGPVPGGVKEETTLATMTTVSVTENEIKKLDILDQISEEDYQIPSGHATVVDIPESHELSNATTETVTEQTIAVMNQDIKISSAATGVSIEEAIQDVTSIP